MIRNNENQTIVFKNKPKIIGNYSIVGPKEGEGNFKEYFDYILKSDEFGEKSYEKAERMMLEQAVFGAIDKSRLKTTDIGLMLSGDLLNQIISSGFAARAFDLSFLGIFGACSTMAEGLGVGAALVDGGYIEHVVCATSSHFSSAERQFRFPLELGNQRTPTSQWTVTGAGASVISNKGNGPQIISATFGKVVDYGIKDVNDMGAAMAPAAMKTLVAHLKDTKKSPEYFDLILTGDLGKHGSEIFLDLLEEEGIRLKENYKDCGHMFFNKYQKTFMGASGCGCSASVLNSFILGRLNDGTYKRILFIATGALLSTVSAQQGDSIPCVAHAVAIEGTRLKGEE